MGSASPGVQAGVRGRGKRGREAVDFETRSTFSCEAATRSAREGTEPNERLSREKQRAWHRVPP